MRDNTPIVRKDALDLARHFNAALLASDQFKSPEAALATIAIAIAPIIARDGRIEADQFLELCGISKRKNDGAKLRPISGYEKLMREAEPKS